MLIVRFLIIACALFISSCAPSIKVPTSIQDSQKVVVAPKVILGPGDVIDVKFRLWPELDYRQSIRPDGKISLQLVDEVMAAGLTPEDLDRRLTDLYSAKLKSPEITVIVVSQANRSVYVGGEVENPGVLPLVNDMSVLQAVINAGGFKETAMPESVIVIRRGVDNKPIPIPVNLDKIISGNDSAVDFQLKPADVIYVPKTAIAKVDKFVKQYIQDLFVYRGFGLTYDLNPNNNN